MATDKEILSSEQAKWFKIGNKTRAEVRKLQNKAMIFDKGFEDWNLFEKSFGWFQFLNRNKPSEEQIQYFKMGFQSKDTGISIRRQTKKG